MTINDVVTIGMFNHIRGMLGCGLLKPDWTEMWSYLTKCAAENAILDLELGRIEAATEAVATEESQGRG